MFWNNKVVLSDDFVELPMGRVYFKVLSNGVVNSCTTLATISEGVLNNNHFFTMLEYQLVNLKAKQLDSLTPEQGMKVRNKLKEILLRHAIIEEEKEKTPFTQDDINQFHLMEQLGIKKVQENGSKR